MPERSPRSAQGNPSTQDQGRPSAQHQGSAVVNELAEQLGGVARLLEAQDDTEVMLDELVAAAVRLVPGAQEGSIGLVVGRGQVTSQHPSGELPEQVDAIQTATGEGPCLDAVWEQQTVRVSDLRSEQRWPQFARHALEAGVGSLLSFQLFVEGDNLGALNLLSREPDAFDDDSEQVGLLLASHAAVAIAGAQKVDDLSTALANRDAIGQAKGMLMERYEIDAEQAFRVLVRISQHSHRKLRDVAAELVSTRQLDALHGQFPAPRPGDNEA